MSPARGASWWRAGTAASPSGTPVVATPNPGALEVLDGGRYGLIVPPGRLGEELLALLMDRGRRDALAEKGLHRAQNFTWDTVAARYETLYAEVVNGRSARRSKAA